MNTPPTISIVRPGGEEMGALISLYERAIPASERRRTEALHQLTGSCAHRVSVLQRAQETLGFSVLFLGAQVGLLEYLAVDERSRGAGLGTLLYEEARLHLGERPMIIEVESTREADAEPEEHKRRIAFYRRRGCRHISGLEYILPLIAEGDPPPLDLLVDRCKGAKVTSATMRMWLQEIYVGAYGCDPHDDRLDAMLEGHEDGLVLS